MSPNQAVHGVYLRRCRFSGCCGTEAATFSTRLTSDRRSDSLSIAAKAWASLYDRESATSESSGDDSPPFVPSNRAEIDTPKMAAIFTSHLGRRQEAAPYIQKLLSLEPDFTIEKFRKAYPFKFGEDRENYCKGLRLAGIPNVE